MARVPHFTFVKKPGCYGWQIDGLTFSKVVVIRILKRYDPASNEKTPPDLRAKRLRDTGRRCRQTSTRSATHSSAASSCVVGSGEARGRE